MKILTAISSHSGDPYNLGEAVLEASHSIAVKTIQEIRHVREVDGIASFHGAIFQIETEEELYQSQSIIQQQTARFPIPYLYLVQGSFPFDVNQISQLFPDQLILTPVSQDHLRLVIRLFLMKIQQGYHINGVEQRERKKIWLTVKRGVYQSLETDRIKWIEASDHYVKVFTDQEDYVMIKASLKDFYEKHLSHFEDFYILNRSLIINTTKVSKIENGNLYIDGDKPLSIPRTKREAVLEVLEVG